MENNNIFKYATKELSQDAFICWCINWINYPENELYNLGYDMLNFILAPYKNCENLYPIKNLKIVRQFKKMDIVITINKEYVVIIEDKIDAVIGEKTNNENSINQLQMYIDKIQEIVNKNDEDALELLELDKTKFDESKVIPVFLKTGLETDKEKELTYRKVNGKDILNILEKYKNKTEIIYDFYESLKDKVNKEDIEKYKLIMENGYLKIGEKFSKKETIYKCFSKYMKNEKVSLRRATYKLTNLNVVLWTPRLYAFNGWKNTLVEENQDITEENIAQNDNHFSKELSDIRFVFARRRDVFKFEYLEFIGVYKMDTNASTPNRRVWNKVDFGDCVSIDVKKIEEKLKRI